MIEFGSNDLAVFWFAVVATTCRRDAVLVIHDPSKIAQAPGAGLIRREGTWHVRIAYRILAPALDRRLIARVLRRAGAIVVLGSAAREELQAITPRPVLFGPLGLDHARAPTASPSAGDYVLFAGFLGPSKGLDVLIRAWADLVGVSLKLVIAGSAARNLHPWVSALREEAARFDRPPDWLGAVEHEEEFQALFRDAAICVLPYRTSSPASGILARAMAAGACVVASKVPAFSEALEDGVSGVLIDVDDHSGLTRAIERLARAPTERDRLGRAAFARSREIFGWDKFATALEEAFALARTSR